MATTKILLADDDDDDREVFKTVISNKTDVTLMRCLENGREVIEFLDRLPEESLPDIIILDQNMPKMNGLETLEYLKRQDRYARITVAIYSTFTDARLVEQYRKLGAALVLTKPSRMEDYNTLVNNILNLLNQRT
ncbi:MAG TPA: response regulator [Flavitalea sp.]|nr:response regulator [Flavitalea sp.]